MGKIAASLAVLLVLVGCGKKQETPSTAGIGAVDNAKIAACANNLKQLLKMQYNYMVQYGGTQKMMPRETGGAFWLKLSKSPTVLIDSSLQSIYACPFKAPRPGATDYRGPASDVNRMQGGDPVGACIGNHPDGSAVIMRKSGDIQTVKEGDSLYQKALETTKP